MTERYNEYPSDESFSDSLTDLPTNAEFIFEKSPIFPLSAQFFNNNFITTRQTNMSQNNYRWGNF